MRLEIESEEAEEVIVLETETWAAQIGMDVDVKLSLVEVLIAQVLKS